MENRERRHRAWNVSARCYIGAMHSAFLIRQSDDRYHPFVLPNQTRRRSRRSKCIGPAVLTRRGPHGPSEDCRKVSLTAEAAR